MLDSKYVRLKTYLYWEPSGEAKKEEYIYSDRGSMGAE
jgi:hypothetical protein